MMWGALGFFIAAGMTAAVWTGCQRDLGKDAEPPAAPIPSAALTDAGRAQAVEEDPVDAGVTENEDDLFQGEEVAEIDDAGVEGEGEGEGEEEEDTTPPGEVHYAGSIVPQASIFAEMEWDRDKRIGYIRSGARVAIDPTPIKRENCTAGWYRVLSGGYVCGRHVTLNMNNAAIRLGRLPDIEALLPYQYGWNNTHGAPLYRSVPSKAEMLKYEPYLNKPKKEAKDEAATKAASLPKEGAKKEKEADPSKPWWQARAEGTKAEVKLADLSQGADGVLARRLVRGFFIAIERKFQWDGRWWYKTTEGLVTPADRYVITKASSFQGVELEGTDTSQGVGFILVPKARKYEITFVDEKPKLKTGGKLERHASFRLTGETLTLRGDLYRETTEGWWMKDKEGTYTDPGPPPEGLQPGEKWIDVNLTRQSLVAFEGETPIFATLVSTGKRLRTHATPTGTWRVGHKHIAARMSGNGVSPGEAPYSIDDVPYIMYYEGSYALHAAFWHDGYGRVRSHGCTNLSPLDAKRLFYWADPPVPEGWHGVYSTEENPGTIVVVHD